MTPRYVAPSTGRRRWRYGELKTCDRCGVLYEWNTTNFYRRYKDAARAAALGYTVNLQPHCKQCSRKGT